jgi:hypothetical protein
MAKVEIIKLGHALIEGERGEKGGKPSKDSVWGIAYVGNALVKFYGRRGGKLRFKTEKKAALDEALALFEEKLAGKDVKGIKYVDVSSAKGIKETCPSIVEDVSKGYYAAVREGKVNTRSTKGARKAAEAEA